MGYVHHCNEKICKVEKIFLQVDGLEGFEDGWKITNKDSVPKWCVIHALRGGGLVGLISKANGLS
jgi:hypothetical protein